MYRRDGVKARELLPALYRLLIERPAVKLTDIGVSFQDEIESDEVKTDAYVRDLETALETAYFLSARNGLLDVVKKLVTKYKCDLRCRYKRNSDTPLLAAARGGHLDIVKYLISKQKVAVYGTALVHEAAREGHLDIIKYLIGEQKVAVNGTVVVREAVRKGHLDIIKYLIGEQKVAVDYTAVVGEAAWEGHLDIVKYLIGEQNRAVDRTAVVCAAARKGHLDIVKYIIEEQHCSPTDDDYTSLRAACAGSYVHVVEYLLSTGKVDLQARDIVRYIPHVYGREWSA